MVEVDTTMTHAETGRDLQGFWHRGRQFLDVLKVIIKEVKGWGRESLAVDRVDGCVGITG